MSEVKRDRPWLMRTYSGHSTARASNELYRTNLVRGQTGLSIAFDLPTQTGYDADDDIARGEVGRVGVPVSHLGDMEALFEAIPLDRMNTSMTINATAAWLYALYIALADKRGVARGGLSGTIQNDIVKELPVARHLYLPAQTVAEADHRHDHLFGRRDAEMESGQRLSLSPAGSGRHAGAGDRFFAGDGDPDSR